MPCQRQEILFAWNKFLNVNLTGRTTAGILAKSSSGILNYIVLKSKLFFWKWILFN